jgi:hypothetical protein
MKTEYCNTAIVAAAMARPLHQAQRASHPTPAQPRPLFAGEIARIRAAARRFGRVAW